MKEDQLYNLLHKKLTNQLSGEESASLDLLLSKEGNEVADDISTVWDLTKDFEPEMTFNTDAAFGSLMNKITQEEDVKPEAVIKNISPQPEAKVVSLFSINTIARIAAIFVLCLAAYSTFQVAAYDTYTAADSNSFAMLDDGSSVWLAPGSSMSYSSLFSNSRKVTLEGKAFFDVKRDESRPFIINSNDIEVSVLGTSFTVDGATNTVDVSSGKVKVAAPVGEVTLTKGQSVDASKEELIIEKTTNADFKWINPALKFDNTPLDQVIKELSAHFGVSISYKGRTDLSKCPFTATNLSDATLDQVIIILQATYDMDVEREENSDQVYLSSVRCR